MSRSDTVCDKAGEIRGVENCIVNAICSAAPCARGPATRAARWQAPPRPTHCAAMSLDAHHARGIATLKKDKEAQTGLQTHIHAREI